MLPVLQLSSATNFHPLTLVNKWMCELYPLRMKSFRFRFMGSSEQAGKHLCVAQDLVLHIRFRTLKKK